jgi:serine/threonine protein kinase
MGSPLLIPNLVLQERRLELLEQIGEGGQAVVWRVRELEGGRELVAKLFVLERELRGKISEQSIDAEIKKLSVLSSQYLVIMHYPIYELLDSGDLVVGYTMPFANGGTLESNDVYRKKLLLDRKELVNTMLSIARGLSAIHDLDFVHGDIKPSNVLLFVEKNLTFVRISDLGAAYFAPLQRGFAWDLRYAAPERFERNTNGSYDKRISDIYSLGLLFFELITGEYAYGENIYFEFPRQGYEDLHFNRAPNWEKIPSAYRGLVDLLERMVEKSPEKRAPTNIDYVVTSLEGKASESLVETPSGHRQQNIYFPPNLFIWNPRLHKHFGYVKKLYFINSPQAFDLADTINRRLLSESPSQGFTLFISFGAADIVLTSWELEKSNTIRSLLDELARLGYGNVEEYQSGNVLYRESRSREKWEQDKPIDVAKTIVDNTAPKPEIELEKWLKNQRYIFNRLIRVAQHGVVRLLLKVEANDSMDREHDPVVRSVLDFLHVHYRDERGGKRVLYPFKVYTDINRKRGNQERKHLFVELYGRDIYQCSRGVIGIIRAIGSLPLPSHQHFNFSSYIQFDQENILESEDGALAEILHTYREARH